MTEQDQTALFDVIIGRNVFTHITDKVAAAQAIRAVLKSGGRLALAEIVPRQTQRLAELIDLSGLEQELVGQLIAAEEAIYANPEDPMVNWEAADLQSILEKVGFTNVALEVETVTAERQIASEQIQRWFAPNGAGSRATLAQHLVRQGLSSDQIARLHRLFEAQLREQVVGWRSTIAYVAIHP
jgi:putative ATPase